MTFPKFVLCRSDQGDGGWSLHAATADEESIANGDYPPLASGPAKWDDTCGDWDRPNIADYQQAVRVAHTKVM